MLKGDPVNTSRRPLRHIARFILIGLYTGTRAGAIASASPYAEPGRSHVDLERGIFYRKPIGKRTTKKRQTPAPIPPRLLTHWRRWRDRKLIATCFVEFNGKPVASVNKGFKTSVGLARLPGNAHFALHRRDLADAARGIDLGGGRVPGHVARGPAGHLRPPSPPTPARGCCRDRPKVPICFGGRNGGQLDRGPKRDEKT
jgi:hypothetical protein